MTSMMWPLASALSAAAARSRSPKGDEATASVTNPIECVVLLRSDLAV